MKRLREREKRTKTLMVSDEAYNALRKLKGKDESFSKAILRLTRKNVAGNLLEYVRSFSPDHEFADRLEEVLEKRQTIHLGSRKGPPQQFPADEINLRDPIFTNVERGSKSGKKSRWSVDHDKVLYRKQSSS